MWLRDSTPGWDVYRPHLSDKQCSQAKLSRDLAQGSEATSYTAMLRLRDRTQLWAIEQQFGRGQVSDFFTLFDEGKDAILKSHGTIPAADVATTGHVYDTALTV